MTNRDYYTNLNVTSQIKAEYLHYDSHNMVISIYYLPKHSEERIKLVSEVVPYHRVHTYLDEWLDRPYNPFDYITVIDNPSDYMHAVI
jgi:hypothetical protein